MINWSSILKVNISKKSENTSVPSQYLTRGHIFPENQGELRPIGILEIVSSPLTTRLQEIIWTSTLILTCAMLGGGLKIWRERRLRRAQKSALNFLKGLEKCPIGNESRKGLSENLPCSSIISRDDITLERCIGHGRYGRVYLGIHRQSSDAKNLVAIKRMNLTGKCQYINY